LNEYRMSLEDGVEEQEQLRAALIEMVRRARGVVAVWEHGDLAGRIHDLEELVEELMTRFGFIEDDGDEACREPWGARLTE